MILTGVRPDHEFESAVKWDELIGEGTTRQVFGVVGESNAVIKRSKIYFHQFNHVEWIVWNALTRMADDILGNQINMELQEKFAICYAISHSGKYIMMERLEDIENYDINFINDLPEWLNDKKKSAIGLSREGKIKVMDYANVNFYSVLNPKNFANPF